VDGGLLVKASDSLLEAGGGPCLHGNFVQLVPSWNRSHEERVPHLVGFDPRDDVTFRVVADTIYDNVRGFTVCKGFCFHSSLRALLNEVVTRIDGWNLIFSDLVHKDKAVHFTSLV